MTGNLSIDQTRLVNNLSKYALGVSINQSGEASYILPGVATMGVIEGTMWGWRNRKDLKGGAQKLKQNGLETKNIINNTKKYSGNSLFTRLRNKWAGTAEAESKAKLQSMAAEFKSGKTVAGSQNSAIKTLVNKALKSGKNYTASLKEVERLQAFEKLNTYNAKVEAQRASGSVLRNLKDTLKLTDLSKATKGLAAKSGIFRTLMKGVKGNAGFAILSLGIGLLTDVIPAFKLGKDKGVKQLGKTVVKTGCEVAGWAAGSALGGKLGALIGTCICPGLGTVIGGAVGILGGFVGSLFASKLADKIVGENEVEKAEKEAAQQVAQNASQNTEDLEQLVQTVYCQLLEKTQNGEELTKDDIAAKEALEELLGCKIDLEAELKELQQSQAQGALAQTSTTQVQTPAAQTQTSPSFTSANNSAATTSYYNPYSASSYANNYGNPFGSYYYNPYSASSYYGTSYDNPFSTGLYNGGSYADDFMFQSIFNNNVYA